MTALIFSQLQKLDGEVERVQQRLRELQTLQADHHALQDAETQAQAAHVAATDQRRQLRDRELELKTLETRIAELEQKLYGGRIRNPKELENFEKELQMFKHQHGKLEETVLALMETSEQSDALSQRTQAALNTLRAERARQEQAWQAEQAELTTLTTTLQDKLKGLRVQADADELSRYDKLRRTRSGLAVVALNGFNCGACGLSVPMDTVQKARDENTLATCDHCGRILYHAAQL
jgi:predicted  nucleic acid-binding Zn-ribbon protein